MDGAGLIKQRSSRPLNLSTSTSGKQRLPPRRGRHAVAFFETHCVLRAAGRADVSVPYAAISNVAVSAMLCARPLSTLPAAHVVSTDLPSVQIIDSIPNDTKGRVLVFLHLAR